MFMTPKNVISKFLSVPIYSTSGVLAMAALILIVPGGTLFLAAILMCWVADRLTHSSHDHIDTTIEEYEKMGGVVTTYGDIIPRDFDGLSFYFNHADGSRVGFKTYAEMFDYAILQNDLEWSAWDAHNNYSKGMNHDRTKDI